MKSQAKSVQYTIRGIPPDVDKKLRRKAANRHISLNQLIVEELTMGTVGVRKRIDLSDVIGKWTPDPDFDVAIASQRQIDWEKWK